MTRIFHGIEVIEVPKEFIEAVDRGKEFVQIAEVVLAELSRRIPHRLEHRGGRWSFRRHADRGSSLPDRSQACADWKFACNEVRAARRAACFRIVVRKPHTFRSQSVEV